MINAIKEKVVTELEEMIGQSSYLCDLGMELSSNENANGSWYCSTHKAKEEVKENFDFCGDFVNWYDNNIGGILNPFSNVEDFHCKMMIFAVEGAFSFALNKTEYSDLWNDKFEITEEFINKIKEALEDIEESDIF